MKTLLLSLLLAGSSAQAGEAAAERPALSEVSKWFENLKKVLADSSVRRHQRRMRSSLAVAAVRGSGQGLEDPAKPYWKGTAESKQERQDRRERGELSRAADLALAGKNEEALKALEAFEAAHPNSSLISDCRQAKERLASGAAPPKADAAPAAQVAAEAPASKPAEAEAPKPAEGAPSTAPLADEEPPKTKSE